MLGDKRKVPVFRPFTVWLWIHPVFTINLSISIE